MSNSSFVDFMNLYNFLVFFEEFLNELSQSSNNPNDGSENDFTPKSSNNPNDGSKEEK